jgi:hypothetical protein
MVLEFECAGIQEERTFTPEPLNSPPLSNNISFIYHVFETGSNLAIAIS